MFSIQVPVNRFFNVPELITLGGDEFYLGFLPPGALDMEQNISRRPGIEANPPDRAWLANQIKLIKKAGKKVFVVFNEHFYPPVLRKEIIISTGWLVLQGIDGLILSDPGLVTCIKQQFPELILIASTGMEITNSAAVNFFRTLGFSRIILPRQLTIPEIRTIIKDNKGIEFEIFIKNDSCPNQDGLCSFVHGIHYGNIYGQACRKLRFHHHCHAPFIDTACGVCSLFDIKDINLLTLKIVGRDKPFSLIKKDLLFLKKAIDSLSLFHKQEDFHDNIRALFREIYDRECRKECYY